MPKEFRRVYRHFGGMFNEVTPNYECSQDGNGVIRIVRPFSAKEMTLERQEALALRDFLDVCLEEYPKDGVKWQHDPDLKDAAETPFITVKTGDGEPVQLQWHTKTNLVVIQNQDDEITMEPAVLAKLLPYVKDLLRGDGYSG